MIPIFRKMAKLVQGPTRFTHPEWTTSNLTHYANAESERAAAERLVEESKRLSEETAKRTEKTQRDVSKKLGKFQYSLMLYICHHMVEFFHVLIILSFTSIQSFITCSLYSWHMFAQIEQVQENRPFAQKLHDTVSPKFWCHAQFSSIFNACKVKSLFIIWDKIRRVLKIYIVMFADFRTENWWHQVLEEGAGW